MYAITVEEIPATLKYGRKDFILKGFWTTSSLLVSDIAPE